MDKDEIIILSSDEESDFPHQIITISDAPLKPTKQEPFKNLSNIIRLDNLKEIPVNQSAITGQKNKPVELANAGVADSKKKLFGTNQFQNGESTENCHNHSEPSVIVIDEPLSSEEKISTNEINLDLIDSNIETGTKINVNKEGIAIIPESDVDGEDKFQDKIASINENSNQNLKFFTEFVELCGSLEEVETDRAKLTKKLMKCYGEADSHYIKSEEFRSLIQKYRDKVTEKNLYIIASELSQELMYRKKIKNNTGKTENTCQRSEKVDENFNKTSTRDNKSKTKKSKKKMRLINKIFERLDLLGLKIQELEAQEVDFSDEEESAYVQLQRYRERYYQIYKRLSKFTDELPDIDRIYNQKIYFTESKYPQINKCIERWLNKTRRFPDFSDIMKLLESQSTALGLPSDRDAIRPIAIEIFQQVGSMLQRKRRYELWNSLCGYLNDRRDPACEDASLDEILRKNSEIRIEKEKEIIQHYAELQEKQRLEPEEVPDDEANRSPIESENEDDEEVEEIEERVNKRLDEVNGHTTGENVSENEEDEEETEQTPKKKTAQSKGSKNNYKNCKSLKWRAENPGKTKSETVSSEESNTEQESEKAKEAEDSENDLIEQVLDKSEKGGGGDSSPELVAVNNVAWGGILDQVKDEAKSFFKCPLKRARTTEDENQTPKKNRGVHYEDDDFKIEDEIDCLETGKNEVFDVHYCQIFTDNVFDELDWKKDWGKRKVFRDLTNLNRLMDLHGRKRKISGFFSSSLFHPNSCEFDKSSWKKKFKVGIRAVGSWDQKCALNQEEKSGKTVNSDSGGDSDEKDVQNNSEGRGDDEGNNFFRGHGNGSEGDNNEDENKKSGRTDVELNEPQREEEDDEEEEENNAESTEHSSEKTNEQSENKTPSESADKSDHEEMVQLPDIPSETPKEEQREEKEDGNIANESKEDGNLENEGKEGGNLENESKEAGNLENENKEEQPEVVIENHSIESVNDEDVTKNETPRAEESKPEGEELKAENESTDVTVEEKPNEDADVIAECDPSEQNSEPESVHKLMPPKETHKYENVRANTSAKVRECHKIRTSATPKECESVKSETTNYVQQLSATNKPTTTWKSTPVEPSSQKPRKRTSTSTSDEEIVKRFLLHSPSSISITPPRKLTLSKSPSQAALQALATLRNLKGISATIVRGKPKDNANGGSYSRRPEQRNQSARRGRSDFPVISNAQTVTPKIVNVSGNVSGFDNSWPGISSATCDSSSIKISNVWGSLPTNFMTETMTPGCSSQKSNPGPSNTVKKKNTKKTVEYVVLE